MPNEVKVSRKLFISCVLILCIIFIGIVVAQHNYYENKIKDTQNSEDGQLVIIDSNNTIIENIKIE